MTLTAGGHVKMGSSAAGSGLPGIRGGMVRPLAITSKERFPDLPDLVTTAEIGYPSLTSSQWNGVSGPPNLPSSVIEAWNKAVQKAVKDPKFVSQLRNVGSTPFYLNSNETKEYVKKETEDVEKTYGLK